MPVVIALLVIIVVILVTCIKVVNPQEISVPVCKLQFGMPFVVRFDVNPSVLDLSHDEGSVNRAYTEARVGQV